jgi:hypothetical protein
MKAKEYDIIIPVGLKDTGFVWRVVKYIRKCMPEADHIYILTAEKNFRYLTKVKDKGTVFLNENELCEGLTFHKVSEYLKEANANVGTGWYFQQFLKYGFSLSKYAKKYYLSWDADTLPLAHIDFFNEDNKPMFTMKTEYNPNYFKTIKKLLGIDKQTKGSFISEHMLFSTNIVRELIDKINNSSVDGESWMQKIINACDASDPMPGFSEFETYGSYVLATHPDSYAMRHLNTFRYGGYIRGRQIGDKMLKKISFDTDTMSFELGMNPAFPANIPNLWLSLKVQVHKAMIMGIHGTLQKIIYKLRYRKLEKQKIKSSDAIMSRLK